MAPTAQQAAAAADGPAGSAAAASDDVITPQSAWVQRLDRHSERKWTTYQGWWTMYTGAGTDNMLREYPAIRCFRRAGEGGQQLLHRNLIAANLGFGSPVERPDGFWESNVSYSVNDATYSCSTRPHSGEEVEKGLLPHMYRRLTTATADAYLVSPAALPPPEREGEAAASGGGPAGGWFYEAFFEDDSGSRWSMGAGYEASGRLQLSFFIREYALAVDPESHIDPDSLPIPAARPSLGDAAAAAGLTAGRRGRLTAVQYGGDGLLRRKQEADGAPAPPLEEIPGHILLRYPDGMYAHIPETLPRAGDGGAGPVTFKWGGKMRAGSVEVQQMTASFAADSGALLGLTSFAG